MIESLDKESQKVSRERIDFDLVRQIAFWFFVPALVYVIFRYNFFKGVPWANFPTYVVNKALALAGVGMMCASYVIGPLAKLNTHRFGRYRRHRKYLGVLGLSFMMVHGILSLVTLTPAYHAGHFSTDGTLQWRIEISLLLGAIALLHLFFIGILSVPVIIRSMEVKQWLSIQRSGLIALALGLGHLVFLGVVNWADPSRWYGGMPPSTLVASVIIAGLFVQRRVCFWLGTRKSSKPYSRTERQNIRVLSGLGSVPSIESNQGSVTY